MNSFSPITYEVHTYGCKVNTYDSGILQSRLNQVGFVATEKNSIPKVHILNTCAVTAAATLEAVKMARRLKIKNPFSLVVVTGCAAQVDTAEFTRVPGVDLVVANSHKGAIAELIRQYYAGTLRERVHKSNIFKKEDLEPGGGDEAEHTRAFLKIQDGCDSFCTFCVIPFARGKSRSLSVSDLVRRINELVSADVKEVVLTGVHIGDYADGESRLEDLITAVLEKTKVVRIRLSSLEPIEVTPRLLALYGDSRLCPHFHMSIQSAETRVLEAMKRKYSALDVEQALRAIANAVPESFVGMDVIAGFPGETETEFIETCERLEALPWTRLHVFPYSARPGTYAARSLPAVAVDQVRRRSEILRTLSARRFEAAAFAQVGKNKLALALRNGRMLTRDYWPVELGEDFQRPAVNEEIEVQILGVRGHSLIAKPLTQSPS